MMTYKLWLKPDEKFPQFKKLAFKKVEVPISDVLLNGVHPLIGKNRVSHVIEKIIQILNSDEMAMPELKDFDYCGEFKSYPEDVYYQQVDRLQLTLKNISESIYFVDDLSYPELLAIARKSLTENWSHQTAYTLLNRVYYDFNAMRTFLKKKNKKIKLSGYNDISRYDLSSILTLEDFEGEDKIIISEGLPIINFRSSEFIRRITNEKNHLKLTSSINHFQMRYGCSENGCYQQAILYNCNRKGKEIRMHPVVDRDISIRYQAKRLAEKWRLDNGMYCFTVDIDTTEKMLSEEQWEISFPNLNYQEKEQNAESYAYLTEESVPRYIIGRFLSSASTGGEIKTVLKSHSVSMTGRKEELISKLAKAAAQVYNGKKRELDEYFSKNRFIRIEDGYNRTPKSFPVLEDCQLRNMVLAMYAIKHLRGNTILEASHNNNTFDLVSLAKSLITGEVSVSGSFVSVNGTGIN